jgi:GNAT superfamily N-acetyltransferase
LDGKVMGFKLRSAALTDLDSIYAIRRDAILGIPTETDTGDLQAWADQRAPAFYASRLAAGQVVIADLAGEDVGWGSRAEEWITGLYVRTAWGRRGVGRILMAKLESEIGQRGHRYARLTASPNAVGFYMQLGYTSVGPPDEAGAVPMMKRLEPAEQ